MAWLDTHIQPLEARITEAADADPRARRLMTHPGVGALTALATVLVLGPVERFPTSKRLYYTILHRHGRAKAKVAVARKLLVRLYIMLRDQIDYDEFRRRGQPRRLPALPDKAVVGA